MKRLSLASLLLGACLTALPGFAQFPANSAVDDYGCVKAGNVSSQTGSAMHVAKVNNHWRYWSPNGNPCFERMVANLRFGVANLGLNWLMQGWDDVVKAKYASPLSGTTDTCGTGSTANYQARTMWYKRRLMQAAGFNGTSESTYSPAAPDSNHLPAAVPMCGMASNRMPYLLSDNDSYGAADTRFLSASQVAKNLYGNYGATAYFTKLETGASSSFGANFFVDAMDPNWTVFIVGKAAALRALIGVGVTGATPDPYLAGYVPEQIDFTRGVETSHPHVGFVIASTAPYIAHTANGWNSEITEYSDTKNYAKWALQTYVQSLYGSSSDGLTKLCVQWGWTGGSAPTCPAQWGTTGQQITGESVAAGDGTTTTFTFKLAHGNLSPQTLEILGAGVPIGGDNGDSTFSGPLLVKNSGSIDYTGGNITVVFSVAPAAGAAITANYVFGGWFAIGPKGFLDVDITYFGSKATKPSCANGCGPDPAGTKQAPYTQQGLTAQMYTDLTNFATIWFRTFSKGIYGNFHPLGYAITTLDYVYPYSYVINGMLDTDGTPLIDLWWSAWQQFDDSASVAAGTPQYSGYTREAGILYHTVPRPMLRRIYNQALSDSSVQIGSSACAGSDAGHGGCGVISNNGFNVGSSNDNSTDPVRQAQAADDPTATDPTYFDNQGNLYCSKSTHDATTRELVFECASCNFYWAIQSGSYKYGPPRNNNSLIKFSSVPFYNSLGHQWYFITWFPDVHHFSVCGYGAYNQPSYNLVATDIDKNGNVVHGAYPAVQGTTFFRANSWEFNDPLSTFVEPQTQGLGFNCTSSVASPTCGRAGKYKAILLDSLDYLVDGDYPVVGIDWWMGQDNGWVKETLAFEIANWGLWTESDNVYNGHDATTQSGLDVNGFPRTPELSDYGDFLTPATAANATVDALLASGNTSTPSTSCFALSLTLNQAMTPVTLVGSGGAGGPYTFSATGLPTGLTISSSGTISGTPTATGNYPYSVTVTDVASASSTVNCLATVSAAGSPSTSCLSITATLNQAITPVTLVGSGGAGGPYTFSATGLPTGLIMSGTGTISGTPTASGTFNYTVTVHDSVGAAGTTSCVATVSSVPLPSTSCVNSNFLVGFAISPVTLTGSGGAGGPYTFTATGLPPGLTISSAGKISGTPASVGTYPYTVTVTDSGHQQGNASCTMNIYSPPTVACVQLFATVNVAIAPVVLTANGGAGAPYTFSSTGLPTGLTLSTSGTLAGTPTVTGTFVYTVTITDSAGNTGTATCSIAVSSTQSSGSVTGIAGGNVISGGATQSN